MEVRYSLTRKTFMIRFPPQRKRRGWSVMQRNSIRRSLEDSTKCRVTRKVRDTWGLYRQNINRNSQTPNIIPAGHLFIRYYHDIP